MKFNLFICLLFAFANASSQNISFQEMISMVSKPKWEPVNQILMSKGWTYYESLKEDLDSYGTIRWSYNKDYFDKAKGWISLYTLYDAPKKMSFQFHTKSVYNSIQKSIIAAGYKKINSEIENNGISTYYTNKGFNIILHTGKSEDDFSTNAVYTVTVSKKVVLLPIAKKNGLIKEYDNAGSLISECVYKNDILNGPYKIYEYNELVEKGTYENGRKSGKYYVYTDGKLDHEGNYKNDVTKGVHIFYLYDDETGNLSYKSVGELNNNTRSGRHNDIIRIRGKDMIFQFFTYKDDKLTGPFKKTDGDTIEIGSYLNDELSGQYKLYKDYLSNEGELLVGDISKAYLQEEGFYENGVKTGKWKYYDEKKQLVEEINY